MEKFYNVSLMTFFWVT